MRVREILGTAGLFAVSAGLGVCVVLAVGACGTDGGAGMEPAVSQGAQNGAQNATQGSQSAANQQLPALDRNAPADFQTAAFAYG
jgi:hypothetical protein